MLRGRWLRVITETLRASLASRFRFRLPCPPSQLLIARSLPHTFAPSSSSTFTMSTCSANSLVQTPPHELTCPSSASPHASSKPSSVIHSSIASSSLFSIEDSLRDVVGHITLYGSETGATTNRDVERKHPASDEVTDPADVPLPDTPHSSSLQHTASEFNMRVRELQEASTPPTLCVSPSTFPKEGPQGLLSSILAACSLRDDKKPKNKGKEREFLEIDGSPERNNSSWAAKPRSPYRLTGGFNSGWRRQKSPPKRGAVYFDLSEDLRGRRGSDEGPLESPTLTKKHQSFPDMVQITFNRRTGVETYTVSTNTVDSWNVCSYPLHLSS
jgi:hypothetical protein